ncbi:hypothetical protein HETIRDRAFT_455704 [Heterobasidion irregulare TC 32-1]|uniref:Uncharacterized protein n=1 Tax=Heterobasidion irregulare (strain TC 32-1) TaxID=747525 RepID=W4JTC4_HETIT|nr:uncharacterized protein HETIRDRAFT_455704 [Heterobasidion irregulare TC 32-1]ETW76151.1 hypothetical protein HETIRDRAFT_455704 [Heterobasidion irregulare TC 32-1]
MSFSFIRAASVTWRSPQPDIHHHPFSPLTRALTIIPERPAKPPLPSSDAFDDFFGAARTTCTSDSRHHEHPIPSSPPMGTALPPAYAYPPPAPIHADPAFDESELPSYAQLEAVHARQPISAELESITLAPYFFKFDINAAPADWEMTKTPAKRNALFDTMRKAEYKWARRGIAAAALLSVMITAIVIIAVSLSHT